MRLRRPGLRLRLWLGAAALALLAMAAAGLAAGGLLRTQALAGEAMAAQQRVEVYGAYAMRVNDWMIGWMAAHDEPPSPRAVVATLDAMDRLVAEDVARARSEAEATRRARQSLPLARLRGLFNQLRATLEKTPPGTPGGESAIAFYATQAPLVTAIQIDQETRRREAALTAMARLRSPLLTAALAVGLAAPLILAALYALVFRPFFARLTEASRSADLVAAGRAPRGAAGHDELGLTFARLRRISARLERKRRGLEQDHDRLEALVAERTRALSEANGRLERADVARRRFFADVGHELRTPLTVVLGEAELGARHEDPAVRAAFETIRSRSMRLFRRIEDILRIARSESGQLELTRRPVDLRATVEAARSDLAPMLRRAGVSVRAELPDLALAGDPDWLRQVFAGIFENAAKYAGRGATAVVAAREEHGRAVIEIADDGPGLAPEQEAALFDRFSRGEGASAPGFGVGLALAAWVVEASGGALTVAPSEAGLRLRLDLPLWEES